MFEIEIPNGIEVHIEGDIATVKGKNGGTTKKFSSKLVDAKADGKKITVEAVKEKKLARKAALAAHAFATVIKNAVEGTDKGVEKKLQIVSAHFPISLEVKGKTIFIKNIFGERVPREVAIQGDTKIEVKGQEVKVKGVDIYDVTQTIANIRKGCYACGHDTRVFQDGLYLVREE
ncbi:MAG: 50S ribosomal protein L6 [Candidatus Micrarchaeota archaeon]|nr:50S ribosomal protein L6 [Candidatus Micrarchaeota archaeon]MDE1804490.1 50S ribosomal protein L6 [Candidatus Micrarchaeota archaeon]MDE1846453.1 50S ribosomal protein L6 [Candidatus Micrarchaeota archaeon]